MYIDYIRKHIYNRYTCTWKAMYCLVFTSLTGNPGIAEKREQQ